MRISLARWSGSLLTVRSATCTKQTRLTCRLIRRRGNMEPRPFHDRTEACRLLAGKLAAYANRAGVIVLTRPRGGVPVAYEVARALNAPLDVLLVRKLGVPGHEEFAMGAIAAGGVRVLNDQTVRALRISDHVIEAVAAKEQKELDRRARLYRGDRPPPDLRGKTVILVDDGLATGATMLAAVKALRQQQVGRIVTAVPIASPETRGQRRGGDGAIIYGGTPEPVYAGGDWDEGFSQARDAGDRDLLAG